MLSMAINLYSFLNQWNLFSLLHDLIYNLPNFIQNLRDWQFYCCNDTAALHLTEQHLSCDLGEMLVLFDTDVLHGGQCSECFRILTPYSPVNWYQHLNKHDVTVWKVKTAWCSHCTATVPENVCYNKLLPYLRTCATINCYRTWERVLQ